MFSYSTDNDKISTSCLSRVFMNSLKTDKANFVESPVFLLRKLSFLKASGSLFPNLELTNVLTDDSMNVKEKRKIHCKLYTVKSAQVVPFRSRLFK